MKAEASGSSGSASIRSVYSSLSASDSPLAASTASMIPVSVPNTSALSSTIPIPRGPKTIVYSTPS